MFRQREPEQDEEDVLLLTPGIAALELATPGAIALGRAGQGRFQLPKSSPLERVMKELAAAGESLSAQEAFVFIKRALQHDPEHVEVVRLFALVYKKVAVEAFINLLQQITRGAVSGIAFFLACIDKASAVAGGTAPLVTIFGEGPAALEQLADFFLTWRKAADFSIDELGCVLYACVDEWFDEPGDDPLLSTFLGALTASWNAPDTLLLVRAMQSDEGCEWTAAQVGTLVVELCAHTATDASKKQHMVRIVTNSWGLPAAVTRAVRTGVYGSEEKAAEATGTKSTASSSSAAAAASSSAGGSTSASAAAAAAKRKAAKNKRKKANRKGGEAPQASKSAGQSEAERMFAAMMGGGMPPGMGMGMGMDEDDFDDDDDDNGDMPGLDEMPPEMLEAMMHMLQGGRF